MRTGVRGNASLLHPTPRRRYRSSRRRSGRDRRARQPVTIRDRAVAPSIPSAPSSRQNSALRSRTTSRTAEMPSLRARTRVDASPCGPSARENRQARARSPDVRATLCTSLALVRRAVRLFRVVRRPQERVLESSLSVGSIAACQSISCVRVYARPAPSRSPRHPSRAQSQNAPPRQTRPVRLAVCGRPASLVRLEIPMPFGSLLKTMARYRNRCVDAADVVLAPLAHIGA